MAEELGQNLDATEPQETATQPLESQAEPQAPATETAPAPATAPQASDTTQAAATKTPAASTTQGESSAPSIIKGFGVFEVVCAIVLLVLGAVFAFLPQQASFIAPLLGSPSAAFIDPNGHSGDWALIVDALFVLAALILFGTALFARDAAAGDETGAHSYIVMKVASAIACLVGVVAILVLPRVLGSLTFPIIVGLVAIAAIDLVLANMANKLGKQRKESLRT